MTLATAAVVMAIASLYAYDASSPALVVGVFGILIILATWQPVVVLGLLAATLPLFHQPIRLGSSVLAPSELLLAASAAGTLVHLASIAPPDIAQQTGRLGTRRDGIRRLTVPYGVAAIAGLTTVAFIGLALLLRVDDASARSAGLREWRWSLIEPLIFVGLLLWHVTTPRRRNYIVGSFVAGGLAVAIWGLADVAAGGGVSVSGVVRADGPFPHPNAFALYLLRPFLVGTALLIVIRSRNPLLWTFCGIGAVALVATFSRSAALGLLVGSLLLLPWVTRRVRLIGAAAAAALSLGLVAIAGDRAIGGSGADSLALRVDIWRSGLAMIRDNPVAGYGPDQFLYVYSPRYIDPVAWAERFTAHGHNLLIDAWVRTGIIGAVVVIFAVIFIARAATRMLDTSSRPRSDPVEIAAIVTLVAAAAQGMVDNGYFVHDLAMSAWLLAWLAFARSSPELRRGTLLHERNCDRRSGTGRLASL
ncbi:hypothetical protein BH23CHL2_BH23CHL2_19500 [soil metagenome]